MPASASVQKEASHECETVLALPGSKDSTKTTDPGSAPLRHTLRAVAQHITHRSTGKKQGAETVYRCRAGGSQSGMPAKPDASMRYLAACCDCKGLDAMQAYKLPTGLTLLILTDRAPHPSSVSRPWSMGGGGEYSLSKRGQKLPLTSTSTSTLSRHGSRHTSSA